MHVIHCDCTDAHGTVHVSPLFVQLRSHIKFQPDKKSPHQSLIHSTSCHTAAAGRTNAEVNMVMQLIEKTCIGILMLCSPSSNKVCRCRGIGTSCNVSQQVRFTVQPGHTTKHRCPLQPTVSTVLHTVNNYSEQSVIDDTRPVCG